MLTIVTSISQIKPKYVTDWRKWLSVGMSFDNVVPYPVNLLQFLSYRADVTGFHITPCHSYDKPCWCGYKLGIEKALQTRDEFEVWVQIWSYPISPPVVEPLTHPKWGWNIKFPIDLGCVDCSAMEKVLKASLQLLYLLHISDVGVQRAKYGFGTHLWNSPCFLAVVCLRKRFM